MGGAEGFPLGAEVDQAAEASGMGGGEGDGPGRDRLALAGTAPRSRRIPIIEGFLDAVAAHLLQVLDHLSGVLVLFGNDGRRLGAGQLDLRGDGDLLASDLGRLQQSQLHVAGWPRSRLPWTS